MLVGRVTLQEIAFRWSLVKCLSPTRCPHALLGKSEHSHPLCLLHEGWNGKRLRKSVSSHIPQSEVWACGLRMKALYCLLVWRPLVCMFASFVFFNSSASPGLRGDITLSIKFTLIARGFSLQPRQRDLSLWFMHQVNICLSCLVWSTAFISCPTFI